MAKEGKHPGGRPRRYKSPEQMQRVIDVYFKTEEKPTICGLALHLGFAQRKSLMDYEGYEDEPEFCNVIKKAKLKVELGYEKDLRSNHVTGAIFALKQFKWKDTHGIDVTDNRMSPEEIENVRNYLETQNHAD